MQTVKWGPSAWKLLHYITFKAPRRPLRLAEQQVYREFFTLIGDILPCVYCRRSYKQFIHEVPIDVSSGEAMCKWLYLVHNKVNKKLDKTDIPDYREVARRYRYHSLPLNDDTAWIFLYCIAFNSRRHYLHVSDVCQAFMTIIDKGTPGNIYEMNSTQELTVLEVAKLLISQVYPQDKENWQRWVTFVPDRLFHDCRYIVNPKTMNDLGWHPSDPQRAHQQIIETAQWYLQYAIPKKHWATFQVPEDSESANNS